MVICCGILLSEPFSIEKFIHIWCVVTTKNLSANSFSINCQLTFVSSFYFIFIFFNSAGVGRTGVFITLSIVLERMRYEGVVDIFQTVKMLRTQRPAMVQTEVSKTVSLCNGDGKEVVFTQAKICTVRDCVKHVYS